MTAPLDALSWRRAASLGFALFLILVLPVVAAAPVIAQEDAEDTEEQETATDPDDESLSFFGTETVTATGTPTDTFDIPAPVIVIDAATIQEFQPNSASDLLRDQPGVDVNGVGPNQTRPIIRGQRGLRILFLQDGLRMNNARRQSDFGEITGLVDIDNVETLELVRGSGSVLYGTDAIGGVLNLITKVPATGTGSKVNGNLGLRYSTADEQGKGTIGINGYANKVSYALGLTVRDAKEYEAPAGSFGDITLVEDTVVNDTNLKDDSINGYFGYRINDQHGLFARYNRYRADETGFGYVDPMAIDENDGTIVRILYPFQNFDRFTVGYDGSGLQSAVASSVDAKVYWQKNERELVNDIFIPIGAPFGLPSDVQVYSENYSDLDTLGIRADIQKIIGSKHLLTYGVEYFKDDSFNTDSSLNTTTLRAPFPISFICGPEGAVPFPYQCVLEDGDDIANTPNAENIGSGLFVQDSFYASDKFSAIFGLRYAKSETNAKPTPGLDVSGLDFSDDDVVGALNLTYSVLPQLNLVGSATTAFRAPNIIERLFNGPTPEGSGFQILNTDLTSERSQNYDIGVKYRTPRTFFEAIYFDNTIKDAIVQYTLSDEEVEELPQDVQDEIESSGSSVVVQQRNAEKLTVSGFELAGGMNFFNGISFGGNYTTQSGESETGGEAADPTGNTYSDKVAAWLRYDQKKGKFWAEYRFRHNGEQDQVLDPGQDPGPIGDVLPSFTVHTLAGGYAVFDNGRHRHVLGLIIDNLSNELYSEFSNASFFRPQPGRNFVLTYGLRLY